MYIQHTYNVFRCTKYRRWRKRRIDYYVYSIHIHINMMRCVSTLFTERKNNNWKLLGSRSQPYVYMYIYSCICAFSRRKNLKTWNWESAFISMRYPMIYKEANKQFILFSFPQWIAYLIPMLFFLATHGDDFPSLFHLLSISK